MDQNATTNSNSVGWLGSRVAQSREKRRRKAPQSLSPPPRTPADVVAATFANLDLRATKAALDTYYEKFTVLEAENKMLREELVQHEEDSLKVVRHLEEKLEDSEKKTTQANQEIADIIAANKSSAADVMERYDEALRERDRQIAEYASLTERLQGDLRQASRYVQLRQEHAMELKHLHDQLEEMAAKHEKDLTALRFQTLDRKIKLVSLEKTMRQGFKDIVEEEANRLLDLQHRTLIVRSKMLEEEKVDMAHDIDDLIQLANTLSKEKEVMRRCADLHHRVHEEVLRYTVTVNRQHTKKEEKAQLLEAKLRDLLQKYNTVKEDMHKKYSTRIAELEMQLIDTQASLQQHRLELLQARELAKKVVNQRTDLERFFYVALSDCQRYRQQLNKKSASAIAPNNSLASRVTMKKASSTIQKSPAGTKGDSGVPVVTSHSPTFLTAGGVGIGSSSSTISSNCKSQSQQQSTDSSSRNRREKKTDLFALQSPPHADPIERQQTTNTSAWSATAATVSANATTSSGIKTSFSQGKGAGSSGEGGSWNTLHPTKPFSTGSSVLPPVHLRAGVMTVDPHSSEGKGKGKTPPPEPGVYIEDLPWEDKEKIIKSLLFFINSTYYKNS